MPGHRHGPAIKKPKVYEALRRKGMSKTKAARISNAQRKGKGRRRDELEDGAGFWCARPRDPAVSNLSPLNWSGLA